MLTTPLRKPGFWLATLGVALLGLCLVLPALELFPMDQDAYWLSARAMEGANFRDILSNERTFGYPLFLNLVKEVSPTLEALPAIQMACRVLAVLIFYTGLCRAGMRGWLACVASAPLLFTNTVFAGEAGLGTLVRPAGVGEVVPRVATTYTEPLAESLAIATFGFLFLALARRTSPLPWLGFAAALFLAYQVRPAYQFLILLLPPLGVLQLGLMVPRREWAPLRVGGGLLAACLLPWLAWCGLRLALVGHFGLVSFTGSPLCGLAGQLIAADTVPTVPEVHRPFLEAVLARRARLISGEEPAPWGPWKPAFDGAGNLLPDAVDDDKLFVFTQLDLFRPVAMEFVRGDPLEADQMQVQVALALIRAHPSRYAQWVFESLRRAPGKVLRYNAVVRWLLMALILGCVLGSALYAIRHLRHGREAVGYQLPPPRSFRWELNFLLPPALGFLLGQVLVVAMTVASQPRYYDTAAILVPPVQAAALVALAASVWTRWKSGPAAAAP